MPRKIVVASGYFDPLHCGHVEYLQRAKALGDKLIVIVNNDSQALQKKGFVGQTARERVMLIRELECVDMAIESFDDDRTVRKTLAALHPDIFANGGDQSNDVPEAEVCDTMQIEMVDGLGDKVQSSRSIVKHIKNSLDSIRDDYLTQG